MKAPEGEETENGDQVENEEVAKDKVDPDKNEANED